MICFASIFITVTCTACEASHPYQVSDYLEDLAMESGIGTKDDDFIGALAGWGVIENAQNAEERLTYGYLMETISALTDEDQDTLYKKGWFDRKTDPDDYVSKQEAEKIIDMAVDQINDPAMGEVFEYELQEGIKKESDELDVGDIYHDGESYRIVTGKDGYGIVSKKAEFEEVYRDLELAKEYEIDFSKAEIIPYHDESDPSMYRNDRFELLSAKKHRFKIEGFDVTYTVNVSGISVHAEKKIDGYDVYADLDISNVKPKIKWTYREGDLKNCFFSVDFNSSEKLGAKTGRYGDYYLKFKDLDSSSFSAKLRSMIDPVDDKVDVRIPICKIRSPIPEIPTAYINLELLLHLSATGKVQLQLYNSHQLGFETKDGQIRFIRDCKRNFDSLISASAFAGAAVNISAELAKYRLADVEVNNGLKSEASSTLHLYDEEGELSSQDSEIAYTTLQEISRENEDVKVCGDLSFCWLSNIIINTAKTRMYRYGLTAQFELSGEDDQIFGDLHHIENGHFVKECTRRRREKPKKMEEVVSRRIVLDSYAEVLKLGTVYEVKILSLPEGHDRNGVVYESSDDAVASVDQGTIRALKPGNCRISVSTADRKHSAYINILVSDS